MRECADRQSLHILLTSCFSQVDIHIALGASGELQDPSIGFFDIRHKDEAVCLVKALRSLHESTNCATQTACTAVKGLIASDGLDGILSWRSDCAGTPKLRSDPASLHGRVKAWLSTVVCNPK